MSDFQHPESISAPVYTRSALIETRDSISISQKQASITQSLLLLSTDKRTDQAASTIKLHSSYGDYS
ncbi:hypothetical protein BofuT4_uP014160.1 [Botrytis cinerea T4]|uniref:Uncharacterized protein n=1 Tax=Botryotinia fuckeliana (strain T4) TaxID=999810 RepID=G2XN32_BOTF4|nr:hypothetical protein BofuT4_uP014160.1 [Botrytis cinerea T4]